MKQHLQMIHGVVSGLAVHAGEEEFLRSTGEQAVGVGAAAGLALGGLDGAAVGSAMSASSAGDTVELFTCTLNGHLLQGRFSKVTFQDGDELDVVVSIQQSEPLLGLAARRERDQVLWTMPHCSRGTRAHRRFALGVVIKLFSGLLAGGALFIVLMQYLNDQSVLMDWFAMAVVAVISSLAAPYYAVRFYRQWLPIAKQAEQIFSVLGYPDPANVDLPRDHRRYCRSKGIKWPYTVSNGVDAGPWTYHYVLPSGAKPTRGSD